MALITVTSTGDFKIRWGVLSMSFSEREREKWPLGKVIFIIIIIIVLSVMIVFSTLERYLFATPN